VPLKAIISAREIDKQRNDSIARTDSIRARTDTAFRRLYQQQHRVPTDSNARNAIRRAAALAAVTPSKPIPVIDILITLTRPLTAGATYRIDSKDIHNLMGVAANSVRSFTVPKPAPPPAGKNGASPQTKADSARSKSAGAKPTPPAGAATTPTPPAPAPAPTPAPAPVDTSKKQPPR
jgi:hypothetical protein